MVTAPLGLAANANITSQLILFLPELQWGKIRSRTIGLLVAFNLPFELYAIVQGGLSLLVDRLFSSKLQTRVCLVFTTEF